MKCKIIGDTTLHKKLNLPLRDSSVNATKSAGNCGFGQFYWKNPWWKNSFFVQCKLWIWAKMESSPINYSWVGVFKIWLIVISFWDFVAYNLKEFQNETPVTLVIGILRLSTRKQISLSGCTFSQKDFTQEDFTSKRLYFKKTLVNLSLGIKLNLHKPHHTTCKIVFYCGVLKNGF